MKKAERNIFLKNSPKEEKEIWLRTSVGSWLLLLFCSHTEHCVSRTMQPLQLDDSVTVLSLPRASSLTHSLSRSKGLLIHGTITSWDLWISETTESRSLSSHSERRNWGTDAHIYPFPWGLCSTSSQPKMNATKAQESPCKILAHYWKFSLF